MILSEFDQHEVSHPVFSGFGSRCAETHVVFNLRQDEFSRSRGHPTSLVDAVGRMRLRWIAEDFSKPHHFPRSQAKCLD